MEATVIGSQSKVELIQQRLTQWITRHKRTWQIAGSAVLATAAVTYLGFSIHHDFHGAIPLIVLAVLAVFVAVYYGVKLKWGNRIRTRWLQPARQRVDVLWDPWGRRFWYVLMIVAFVVFLVIDIRHTPFNFVSLAGIAVFIIGCVIFSKDPASVPWRVVMAAHCLQFLLGLVLLRWPTGASAVQWFSEQLIAFINYGLVGAEFVFGENFYDHYFAMALMPILCFFSAVTNLLYYWGIIQFLIRHIGGILYFFIGTTPVETFIAVSAIFLGPDISVLMVKSSVPTMTPSQLHTVMALALATIDGGMIAVFEGIGVPAKHLITASFMSAPAALAYSKILFPGGEDEQRSSKAKIDFEKPTAKSSLGAFVEGATTAVPIIAVVLAMLISSVSLLEFVNTTLTWMGHRAGIEELTIEWSDCHHVSRLIGLKVVLNEVVAYTELGELIDNRLNGIDPAISVRSEAVAAYALCGFSNFGTAGFMVGFLCLLAPARKADIGQNAFRCLVASNLACFSTACIAALLYKE
ncbi:hypothetical protein CAPTEDRAFT_207783 [Capitella teleta]|uniref:Sodium/nucleoside cotransporter n=1 Tax=Capitella teleta TaxID=283909 RepID=R7U4M9_CAPTE|nr:hypothetical protein CAPTEDRAFT_207783 [Capitella teleta]|eukprot:ELT98120.1 hypothetical protein CAPTEDRAFT_207783 [Capitella teleta]